MVAERHSLQVRSLSEATIKTILTANQRADAEVCVTWCSEGVKPYPHISESGPGLFSDQVRDTGCRHLKEFVTATSHRHGPPLAGPYTTAEALQMAGQMHKYPL